MSVKTVAPLTNYGNRRKSPLVGCFAMGILNREVGEVELIPVAKGIVSRWWIVLIAALLGTVAMWSQESDLVTTPAITEVVRTYESRDETSLLSIVGIDPITISPLPSFDNQILQVQSQASREKISKESGTNVTVTITRSEQRFSLLNNSEGDGQNKFTFMSVGNPTYTFSCSDRTTTTCDTAIDAYVGALIQVRKASIIAGLQRIKSMLSNLQNSGSITAAEKITGIESAFPLITGEMALLSRTEVQYGGTITTVKKSTYGFGFVAGTLIGLLIALQLTIVDKRVRSLSQLAKHVERADILGHATAETASIQHVAAALVARARQASQTTVVLIPSTPSEDTSKISLQINAITKGLGVEIVSQPSVASISAEVLVTENDAYIVVATTNVSKTNEITDTWSVLQGAQRAVIGTILVDAQY